MQRLLGAPVFLSVAMIAGMLVGLGAGVAAALPSPYYVITPGGAYEIGPRLRLPDERRREMGRLAFTAVFAQPASWLDLINARRNSHAEIVPAEEIRPPGASQEEVNEANKRLIDESKPIAAGVGLRAAGFEVRIAGQGALVESVVADLPADGVLKKGDTIVTVDGQTADTAPGIVEIVRRHQVGDQVRLGIIRDGQRQEVALGTRNSPTEPGVPVIGVRISTYLFEVQLPFPVDIESDNIGGPSAGMMFSLATLDAVTDGDLTRGYYVAGTGTIAVDGSVGPIGGAAEKVVAAEEAGAQLFLIPRENYEAARYGARAIRLMPIDRLADAVRELCALDPLPGVSPVSPTPCTQGLLGGLG